MAENNEPNAMSFEDFLKATSKPAAEEPSRKVIPPKKSAISEDPLAEAFMAHGILVLMIMAIGGGADSDATTKQMEELALDAAARFRGRVIAGEISL